MSVERAHTIFEALGLFVAGPAALVASQNTKLSKSTRGALFVSGIGTVIVDAWLLKKRSERALQSAQPDVSFSD